VVPRGEVERGRLADARDLDRVVVGEAVRRVFGRRIRNAVEQLLAPRLRGRELLFQLLQLGLDPVQLLDLLG